MKYLYYISVLLIFSNCKAQTIKKIDYNIMNLDKHILNIISKSELKLTSNYTFLHILDFKIKDSFSHLNILTENNFLEVIEPIFLDSGQIQSAITLIIVNDKIIASSDGRYVYSKGFNNDSNLLEIYRNNKSSVIIALPYVDLAPIFFCGKDRSIKVYDNFLSKQLINFNEYNLSSKVLNAKIRRK